MGEGVTFQIEILGIELPRYNQILLYSLDKKISITTIDYNLSQENA